LLQLKKEWADVADSYTIDFGDSAASIQKRILGLDKEKAFTVPLTSNWPSKIFDQKNDYFEFKATCNDCGIKGSLLYAGHIAGNIRDGITTLVVSATPQDIEADLNLEVDLTGHYEFSSADTYASQQFTLLDLPIPGGDLQVPGILNLGPTVQFNAGYKLDSVHGEAKITTGATAKIPNDSIVQADFLSVSPVEINGWVPDFETQPLKIDAEVDAEAKVWTGIAATVELLIFGECLQEKP
jgi:hypothetical protein